MYYICQPQRIEENSFGLTRTSPQSECHEKVYLHQLLKFCTLLNIVPCTDGLPATSLSGAGTGVARGKEQKTKRKSYLYKAKFKK